jgi:hypothetical protein
MVAVPWATPVMSPREPTSSEMPTSRGTEELQRTDSVRSCLEESEKIPVAVSGVLLPSCTTGLAGKIRRETRMG